ncbi:FtsX-like permease family protein, partial [Candidatus Izimaplasma bacterium]|nr:FtsX-like permease family protein [Candidatus Izimaplasma bacterium]
YNNNYKLGSQRMFAHTTNREKAIEYLVEQEAKSTIDIYTVERADFVANRLLGRSVQLTFSILALAASAISFFFIIRSSLLSRIYEISVYRALGISKGDVVKMFVTEVILLTTITSIVGYLITSYIIFRIQIASQDYFDLVKVSIWSFTSGIVIIYAINIVSGIFPISNLLRKTPAEILSKYDF